MKKASRYNLLLFLALCSLVVSCDVFNPEKYGDVIMVDGPHYEDGGTTFFYVGTVRNNGQGKALYVRVYITLKNPDDALLAQGYILVDKTNLEPGESSTWQVTFDDESHQLRDLMDEAKTSYDITWTESDDD